VFRRAMHEHPDWWDWKTAAKVPAALTDEMEEERETKTKNRRLQLKEKMRERQAQQGKEQGKDEEGQPVLPQQASTSADSSDVTSHRLGGGSSSASKGIIESVVLNDQARMRLERERRARAAEARMNRGS